MFLTLLSRHILLLITVFIVGIMQAGLQDFLLWQIHDLPHASEIVYGSYVSGQSSLFNVESNIKLQATRKHPAQTALYSWHPTK